MKKQPTELNKAQLETNSKAVLKIKSAYQRTSKEKEEYFAAKIEGDIKGLFYRITREDNGFDTGLKPLTGNISEDLPLIRVLYICYKLQIECKNVEINSKKAEKEIRKKAEIWSSAKRKSETLGGCLNEAKEGNKCLDCAKLKHNR